MQMCYKQHPTNCINLLSVPLWVHIVAFVQLVFNHLVTANLQRRTSDVHPRQRHSENTRNKCQSVVQGDMKQNIVILYL